MSLKILKSLSVVGSMTLVSRISGLVRDVIFANVLGDKAAADVFFVAFRIPNFFRRIFGEGAFAAAFVPVFTEYRENRTEPETRSFLELMAGRFGLVLFCVTVLGVVFSPLLVSLLAAGFSQDPAKYNLAVDATRITFPYIFFISFVAMAGAMLNTCGRFAAPAATPVLLNICLIGAALLLVPRFDESPIALAIGVLVAGGVQFLFQIPFLKKEKLPVRPRVKAKSGDEAGVEGVGKVFRLTLPAIVGVSVAQVNVIVNTVLASFLVTGSISWLYYSDRLMEFPVGVFGIALSTVILPHLSRIHSRDSTQEFSQTLNWACRWVILVCIPCTAGLILLAEPMVTTIYFHGDFTANGVRMTALSLVAFSLGMVAIVMVKVLAPGFYARQNTRTPVRVAMVSMGLNIVFCLILVSPMKHVGLALATSLSSLFNAAMLFVLLRREGVLRIESGWLVFLGRTLVATLLMGVLLWVFRGEGASWLEYSIWERVTRLFLLIGFGGMLYILALLVMGLRPRALFLRRES